MVQLAQIVSQTVTDNEAAVALRSANDLALIRVLVRPGGLAAVASQIDAGVQTWKARQNRAEHPSGDFDNARRWTPDDEEAQFCCRSIREPSRAWPYTLLTHARSVEHVARLRGLPVGLLRSATRSAKSVEDVLASHYGRAARYDASEPDLRRAARSTRTLVAMAAAAHPLTPPDVLDQLAQSTNTHVLGALAGNPAIPHTVATSLSASRHSRVLQTLARNPAVPEQIRVMAGLRTAS